ncbi:hypothetical protein BR93DRAFT_963968 [Coniochaeta sp. PMI_546]|nr:hypothetical protein BR93DRAFT_963968 [Coniochaeta sp. PMI_546]
MTAKVWCWKVKVTYRCGCNITGNTIHNCDSTMSNCSTWLTKKKYNRECEDCMLEEHSGRNLDGKADTSGHSTESIVEGALLIESTDQPKETMVPVHYTESARKVTTG